MRDWETILTSADRELYATGLFGGRWAFRFRPGLPIVDVTVRFVGVRGSRI